jgi:hypothetical protein
MSAHTPNSYSVSLNPSESQFTAIQDAIEQAVMDGASTAEPVTVEIAAGVFVGDIDLADGVFLVGQGQGAGGTLAALGTALNTVIEGKVTGDFAGASGLTRIAVVPSAGVGVELAGASPAELDLDQVRVQSPDAAAIVHSNSGAGSLLGLNRGEIQTFGGAGVPCIDISGGGIVFSGGDTTISHADSDAGASVSISGGVLFAVTSRITGRVDVSGGFASIGFSSLQTDAQPAVAVGPGSTLFTSFVNVVSLDPGGVAMAGTGSFTYAALAMLGSASGIDPALSTTVGGLHGAASLFYTPAVPANWGGAAPTRTSEATDRLAAAVNGLLDGSILPGTIATGIT